MQLPELTAEERDLLANCRSPDASARDGLLVGEIQTRALLAFVADDAQRAAFAADCAVLRQRIKAATSESFPSAARALQELHVRVVAATDLPTDLP